MDSSESWETGAPGHRAWTQGPWPADAPGQGPADQGPWNPGPGFGADSVSAGDWTVTTVGGRTLARRVLRFLLLSAAAGFAVVAGLIALAVLAWPHGLLAVFLVLLAVPVLLLSLVTAAAIWVGRRAWRTGAWMEAVPVAVGMPWLGRVIWAVRAALVGKAFWRLGQRVRRPRYQPRTGGLSGTTR